MWVGFNINDRKLSRVKRLVTGLFLMLQVLSCTHSGDSNSKESASKKQAPQTVNDSVFENLHQKLYDHPAAVRTQSLLLLQSLKVHDPVSRIKLLKNIGSSYVFESNYTEAVKYYNKALSSAEEIQLFSEIANINNNLGTVYNESGSYTSAYIHFLAALDHYDLAQMPEKKTGTLSNIGLTYLNLNNNKRALHYFDEALKATSPKTDVILVASILNNIALCKSIEKKTDAALKTLNRSIAISEKANNKYGLSISYKIMGDVYQNNNDPKSALTAFLKSEKIAEDARLFHQLTVAKIGVGRSLLDLGKTGEALDIALKAMDLATSKKSILLMTDAHLLLSVIYKKKKDYRQSLEHFQKNVDLTREINNKTVVNQIYDVELKNLGQRNKMQHLEIDKKELVISKKNNLLFFSLLTFILLLGGLYLFYRNHRHKEEAKLRDTVIELNRKKANAALEAEIRERVRIGQNLHDSLGHLLSLAGLNASVLQKRRDLSEEKRDELIHSLMESINEAFDELRTISHNLAPSLLSASGLKGVLKNISTRVNQSSKLRMTFDTFGLEENLDEVVENILYRTLQEIVSNTIKHADADKLFIQITQDEEGIALMAEDDGRGFDYEMLRTHSSLGLSHITSTIENLNGTVFIDTKPGRGTIISIAIPLKQGKL